jgi:hypothetical protein
MCEERKINMSLRKDGKSEEIDLFIKKKKNFFFLQQMKKKKKDGKNSENIIQRVFRDANTANPFFRNRHETFSS